MKVYATQLVDGKVVLKDWPSKAVFQDREGWCNPKFINVAVTTDLPDYEFAHVRTMVVYTEDQKASKLLLQAKFFELYGEPFRG